MNRELTTRRERKQCVSFALDPEEIEAVRQAAAERETSMGHVVRKLIRQMMEARS